MNEPGRPIRVAAAGAGRAIRGGGSILIVVATVGVLAFLLAGRSGSTGAGPSAPPAEIAAASVGAGGLPSIDPSGLGVDAEPSVAADSPSPELVTPPPAATPEPTPDPTAKPTPDATPAPTKRPATPTPRPTHDPAPEPTPWVGKVSGSFGSTLTVGGVSARLTERTPSSEVTCGNGSMADYTEAVSFDLRMTWSDSTDVIEPFLGVGGAPYYYVNWFDPAGWHSGVTYVVSSCVRPGDTAKALIETASNGGPPRTYRFSFH